MKEKTQENRRVKLQSSLLIILIVVGIGIVALLQTKDSPFSRPDIHPSFKKGAPAPNFSLPDLTGKLVNLDSYRDKVVLLHIWATWCLPCVQEMPSLEKLYQELGDEGLEILSVSVDAEGAEVVRPFMKKHKLSFPALTDTAGKTKALYQTTGVPESFIIDKNGIMIEKVIGSRDWASPGAIDYFRRQIQKN